MAWVRAIMVPPLRGLSAGRGEAAAPSRIPRKCSAGFTDD